MAPMGIPTRAASLFQMVGQNVNMNVKIVPEVHERLSCPLLWSILLARACFASPHAAMEAKNPQCWKTHKDIPIIERCMRHEHGKTQYSETVHAFTHFETLPTRGKKQPA